MNENVQSVINGGYFDRAVARLANLGPKVVGRSNRDLALIRRDLMHQLGSEDPAMVMALFDVVESARIARNEGRRVQDSDGPVPGPAKLPNLDDSSRQTGSREQVHVIVEMVDPTTGGVARFPVVIDSTAGMSRERLQTEAAALASDPAHWAASGQRGDISPETARFVNLTVIAVVGRD